MLTLRQLEIFREVVRARTTVGAAEALGVSQPAVSNAIRQIETNVGFALFERIGNRLVPTPDAEEMFRDSEAIFTLHTAFTQRIESRRRGEAGNLRIVTTPPLANALVPGALREFASRRSTPRVHLDTRRVDGVLDAVLARSADIGLALDPPPRKGLAVRRIATAQMVCVFAPGHPLEDRSAVSAADLDGHEVILFERQSPLALVLQRFVTDTMRSRASTTVRYSGLACLLAEAGLGVALVDSTTGICGGRYTLSVRPLYPALPVPICALTREGEPPKRVQQAFLEALVNSGSVHTVEEFDRN